MHRHNNNIIMSMLQCNFLIVQKFKIYIIHKNMYTVLIL